jgi:hypothetical protein
MDSPDLKEIANRFSAIARTFCAAVEDAERSDRNAFLLRIYRVLPQLVDAALQLPEVAFTNSTESAESVRLSDADWKRIYNAVASVVSDWEYYWEVFDPTKKDEPVAGSLADDIADVYRDLSEGVALSKAQHSPQNIIWKWRFSFYTHWGQHAIDALRLIHRRAFELQAFSL